MNIATMFLQGGFIAFGLTFVEKRLLPVSFLDDTVNNITRSYGILLLILSVCAFWTILCGTSIGKAREKYMELAKKDGEKDPELRYALPNLYVEGNTVHARAFNCVQRSHQQILETLPQYLLFSAIAGISFPLTTSASCLLWLYARIVWAKGYQKSEGDIKKRYDHPISKHIWTTLIAVFFMALMTCVNVVLDG
eukprot:CAMPEP_0194147196 /NCGR_PEP_ID=MMETSP0152-20130528/22581_1 /TAXON_ID=1049557 /ORGANISM="Thalassiothrix antarctica, Strain L6-D1" /LENGTH=193 /DNA_ID=CAMNT_0038847907 /DNA_START=58 /DNA_END=636 /DNA_ORIENTATION=+